LRDLGGRDPAALLGDGGPAATKRRSMTARFRALRQFNHAGMEGLARSRSAMGGSTLRYFQSDSLADRIVRALGERHALPVKEIVESFEFFERVRHDLRRACVVDLLAGHGLTGALFAVYERVVERVVLLDQRRPASFMALVAALETVAPWAVEKLEYHERPLRQAELPPASLLAVHACGPRTDTCLDLAVERRLPIAVMPCCYPDSRPLPPGLGEALGVPTATDVDRTYRLRAQGYAVRWTAIPAAVTPMNRILIAHPDPESLAPQPGRDEPSTGDSTTRKT
jgi:hypothetical protein